MSGPNKDNLPDSLIIVMCLNFLKIVLYIIAQSFAILYLLFEFLSDHSFLKN